MSIKWTSYIWERATGVDGTHLLVLLSIADHSGDDGQSFPSVGRLAERARCDERTVQRALAQAESDGWLQRTMRPGRSTLYQLLTPDTGVTPDKMSPPTPTSPHPRHPRHPSGDTHVTHNRKGTSNEPVGAAGEVSQEPAAAVTQHVTDEPHTGFPRFAQARLGQAGVRQASAWQAAWSTVTSIEGASWDPVLHLTKYLAQCTEKDRTPTPSDWLKWFTEDEHRARTDADAAKRAQAQVKAANPYWE